jgi:ABC-2 type transport system permease protein
MTRGIAFLLGPKLRSRRNQLRMARRQPGALGRALVLGSVAVVFWVLLFTGISRMLLYFRGAQGIGDLLAGKLLGMAFLTFGMILLLSNVITALSTFFLSRDLDLLLASPRDPVEVYGARLIETTVNSSWMVLLLAIPLLAGYGVTYGAGPSFLLLALLTVLPFLVIPAVLGSAFTLVLVNVFPARRAREVLGLAGLLLAAGLVAGLRFLRPERLMRPEEFRSLVDFIAVLRSPTSPWLPSEWVADVLLGGLDGRPDSFSLLLLWSTAAALCVMGAGLHTRFHASGYARAQEGGERPAALVAGAQGRGVGAWVAFGEWLTAPLSPAKRQLLLKEARVFRRDPTQWSQLLLLGVLVAVYIYNIRVLPLSSGEPLSTALTGLISFLNLGLAGFVVAAIAARFVFPAVSLEGRMQWLLRTAPIDTGLVFRVKYWSGTLPILLVSVILIVVTNAALGVPPFIFALTTGTMILATFALTALALGFGALWPNYGTENAAEIPTSFGGLVYMMTAVGYLALVVALEAWPVQRFLSARMNGDAGWDATIPLVLALVGVLALTLAAVTLPLQVGVNRVRAPD